MTETLATRKSNWTSLVLPTVVALALFGALYLALFHAPREAVMGEVQRIFYFHVGSAFGALFGWVGCAIASFIFLILASSNKGSLSPLARMLDRASYSLAEVGVLFGTIVLVTGPLWAKPTWGTYWTWEPRLVLMLLTQFLFVGYLVLRAFAKHDLTGKKLAAGIAIIGGPAVYLIHMAVELWGGNHPQVVSGEGGGLKHPDMQLAFGAAVLALLIFFAYLVRLRMEHHRLVEDLEESYLELDDLER